jgi:hypothetical protein
MHLGPNSIVNVHNDRTGNIIVLHEQRNCFLHAHEQIPGKVTTCETPLPSVSTTNTTTTLDTRYSFTSWIYTTRPEASAAYAGAKESIKTSSKAQKSGFPREREACAWVGLFSLLLGFLHLHRSVLSGHFHQVCKSPNAQSVILVSIGRPNNYIC